MATSASQAAILLVDTSVAVALALGDHEQHESTLRALHGRNLGLAGHAAYETFSVLTRLPPPARLTPAAALRLIAASFPNGRFLGARRAGLLLARLAGLGIAGGSVYDALVGAAALEHDLTLASRDRRALGTYRELGVRLQFLA